MPDQASGRISGEESGVEIQSRDDFPSSSSYFEVCCVGQFSYSDNVTDDGGGVATCDVSE